MSGSADTPDTEDQDVSHADRKGTRGLKGTLVRRKSNVIRGQSQTPEDS